MKKIGVLFLSILILVSGGVYIHSTYPILSRWVIGSARIVGKPVSCEVKVNGVAFNKAKIFRQTKGFNGKKDTDYFIFFVMNTELSDGRNVLVIDRENKMVKLPNSNRRDYEVIGSYLFQSKSGANTAYSISNDIKGWNFNPDLKIGASHMEFNLPNWTVDSISKVEITL